MDFYSFYGWITSFLRPRDQYKCTEDQQSETQQSKQQHLLHPFNSSSGSQAAETREATHAEIQLIRSLQFVAQQPHQQHAAGAALQSSNITEIIDKTEKNKVRGSFINATPTTFNVKHINDNNNKNNFSISGRSFVDDPTSISTEMDSTKAANAASTSTSGLLKKSATTPESSDQSIEEDIEEVLEEASEESEEASEDNKANDASERKAASDSSAICRSANDVHPSEAVSSSSYDRAADAVDPKFEIDDEQLSGGQLAQHFVLADDEDEEADGENLDSNGEVSLSASGQQNLVHSRHEATATSSAQPEKPENVPSESLTNQSTSNDVSDFVEDVRAGDDTEASLNDSLELPLMEAALDKSPKVRVEKFPEAASTSKLVFSSTLSEDVDKKRSSTSEKEAKVQSDEKLLKEVSMEHSEKDHSIEEIIERNKSVEMTFDTKDLSSMHASFDLHDDTLVNELLATPPPTPTPTPTPTPHKRPPEETAANSDEKLELQSPAKVLENSEVVQRQVEGRQVKEAPPKILKSLENLQLAKRGRKELLVEYTAKAIDNKSLSATEMEVMEINSRRVELGASELSSLTSSSLFEALENHHLAAKGTRNTSPIADESLPNREKTPLYEDDCDDDESHALETMKLRILSIQQEQGQEQQQQQTSNEASTSSSAVKQMERVPLTDFSKDVLEDITEESERNSISTTDDQLTLSLDRARESERSERTLQEHADARELQQKVSELQLLLASKDACLASLTQQLEASQRNRDSNGEQLPSSGRDSGSQVTNSTEYRTLQEDLGAGPINDFYMELTKRDELIAKLTESLQLSLNMREGLQAESEKLGAEVQQLRKQLSDAMDTIRRPTWLRDQESNGGQRISQISMDLISESDDDDIERQFFNENEDKVSRSSRERQFSVPCQVEDVGRDHEAVDYSPALILNKQLEQFQKYLTPSEVRLFFMVQKKFDDFLCQELEKVKMKSDQELKSLAEKLENEKQEKMSEIEQLLSQRHEQDELHSKAMEDLRKYFEQKCTDLEKQYSDEIFSQKSQRLEADSSSEASEQEQVISEEISPQMRCKDSSPRKRTRAELLLSPSHRQMTPSGDAKAESPILTRELNEMKSFYKQNMYEMQRGYEEKLRMLSERLIYYENRYPQDDFLSTEILNTNNIEATKSRSESITAQVRDLNTSLIIIDQDELSVQNDSQVIQKIIEEYERRLQEQLTLARTDIVLELENQIQNLLSETTTDDHHWPSELILLREKFTAKSQLEIAQLQIKHEEEMSRLKADYDKQLNRKHKRHSTFDLARDFDQIIGEREGLRELSKTFRHVLAELAKCMLNCEDDLNASLIDEMEKMQSANLTHDDSQQLDISTLNCTLLAHSKRYAPNVHSLLEVLEDPNLKDFVSKKTGGDVDEFDLNECLERLKSEAAALLQLSEEIVQKNKRRRSECSDGEKNDNCCEAEEALKVTPKPHSAEKFTRANSFNEQQLFSAKTREQAPLCSLPPDLNRLQQQSAAEEANGSTPGNAAELNFQLHELKNRLVKSEADRVKLQQELEAATRHSAELGTQLAQMNGLNRTDYAEGYGLGAAMKTPPRDAAAKTSTSFAQLQEKARSILSTPTRQQNHDATADLLQMIEDFCREGDRVVEGNKRDREDLQAQIVAADKQLKAIRQFLEELALEREQERDEFLREIEHLKMLLRDKEKERFSFEHASKEVEQQESEIREMAQNLAESNAKRDKFEVELKASIDKIFVLREIISELETQVETKALNERVLEEKLKQLEAYVGSQSRSNDTLQREVQSLKTEIEATYKERIRHLEQKLQNVRPAAEQCMVMDQLIEQLHDVENSLDQKTKALEALHNVSNSRSVSVSEDVSVHGVAKSAAPMASADVLSPLGSPMHPSPRQHSMSMEGVQRIVDKLSKHTRVEEATVKRLKDLEMYIKNIRSSYVELQNERDSLQERMSEQMQRISALQSRLEEQRQRAEELQRAGTADLNIRIHDLQNEVQTLRETLGSRDKQIANLRQQLEKSKVAIDALEAELAAAEQQPDSNVVQQLEKELQQRNHEVQLLREKVKSEMANRLTLPDLMNTMLIDKNEEIDHLKQQLEAKQRQIDRLEQSLHSSTGGRSEGRASGRKEDAASKLSARTLSDILSISEFDEPDVIRRAAVARQETPLALPHGGSYMQQSMETSKEVVANLTHRRTEELDVFTKPRPTNTFDNPHYFQDANAAIVSAKSSGSSKPCTPSLVPRQINFSAVTEGSTGKPLSVFVNTPESEHESPARCGRTEAQSSPEVAQLQRQLEDARNNLEKVVEENHCALESKQRELNVLEDDLLSTQLRLSGLQEEMHAKEAELSELLAANMKLNEAQQELKVKCEQTEQLLQRVSALTEERNAQSEALTKQQKDLANYRQNEEQYLQRLAEQEAQISRNATELTGLRQELKELRSAHSQCAETLEAHEGCKDRLNALNNEIKSKDDRLLTLAAKLTIAEDSSQQLQQQIASMQREMEKMSSQQQQQQSSSSSRQYSVDDIALKVEKELNYSAQLDSNILKAIESEEEHHLDRTLVAAKPVEGGTANEVSAQSEQQHSTDDDNSAGERELLNQLEALRVQVAVERDHVEELRQLLLTEKQHSQEVQEQDALIIEAMRERLEKALAQEDELHKRLDQEQEKCEQVKAQLSVLQRSDSRRNSALMKSPTDSPRRSPRSSDLENELVDRLRIEIKLLTSQQLRERERYADLQHAMERETGRFATELQDRVAYCDRLNQEMERLVRDKELAEQEAAHLQERLLLQSQEIESLEVRIAALQETETRRVKRRDQQLQELSQTMAELQEIKKKVESLEAERDQLAQSVELLRFDLERSASRENKLADALANYCQGGGGGGAGDGSIPQQFLQKMKDINLLLAENTKENRQMAETVQFLVDERRQLQRRCEELEQQQGSNAKMSELEERCNHLLGRYLRVESHRKALVYQKRYLKLSLQSYQASEVRALEAMNGGLLVAPQKPKRHLFKTVALAAVAIQRMKFIGHLWKTGKRIVSKSVFTITQQKRSQAPTISCTTANPPIHDAPTSQPASPRRHQFSQRLASTGPTAVIADGNNADFQQNGRGCQCDHNDNNLSLSFERFRRHLSHHT